jgi:enhancing lycopene biosynthesis protein 2
VARGRQTENLSLRKVLVESARIARGAISPLSQLIVGHFLAVVLPGGFGAAKNL